MKRARRADAARRPRRVEWRAALLALAVVLAYANSLPGTFVLDDQAAVVQNASIRDLSRVSTVLTPAPDSPVAGRPLVNVTFAINYAAGGLDATGYHAWNIGVHLACTLLAFVLIRRTLGLPRVRERFDGRPDSVAFAAALLWAVHPINSEVVNYLSQRTESMMAAFYLLAVYAAARAAAGPHRMAWEAIAVCSCLAGALSKESIATAPVVVAVYDRVFIHASWHEAFRSRRRLYAGLAAVWVVLAVVIAANPRGSVAGFSSGIGGWTYLLNQAPVIVEYLRLAVWPDSLVAFYGWPQPVTLTDVLPEALFVLSLLALTLAALVRAPMAAFPGAWFFITLAPASSVVPIATEVGAERRMYLPLLALAVLAVLGTVAVWRRLGFSLSGRSRIAGVTALTAAVAALGAVTVIRNQEYASPLTLARTIVERRPGAVAHHMFAEQLLLAGRRDEALVHLRDAVAGGNTRARFPLGLTLFNQGRVDEALEQLEAFVRQDGVPAVPRWLEPPQEEVLRARTIMGLAFLQKREWARAAEQAEATLAVVPRYPEARGVLAHARFGQERYDDAVREYGPYVTARPKDVQALLNLGVALVATGRLDAALPVFRQAVEVDPSNHTARNLLAMAEQDSRQ